MKKKAYKIVDEMIRNGLKQEQSKSGYNKVIQELSEKSKSEMGKSKGKRELPFMSRQGRPPSKNSPRTKYAREQGQELQKAKSEVLHEIPREIRKNILELTNENLK